MTGPIDSSGLGRTLADVVAALGRAQASSTGPQEQESPDGTGEAADGRIQVRAVLPGRIESLELDPSLRRLSLEEVSQEIKVAVNAALADLQSRAVAAAGPTDLGALTDQLKDIQFDAERQFTKPPAASRMAGRLPRTSGGPTVSVVSLAIDPTYGVPVYQVEDQRYDLLGEWLTTDLGRFFLVVLDALAMADEVARGEPPFDEWSSENYAVSFTPSALLITNLWVPGAEGEFPSDVARSAIEDYWRFLLAQPERPGVREYRPDLPEWQANLLRWEEKRGRQHPYRGRFF